MLAIIIVLFFSVSLADKSNIYNGNDFHDLRFDLKQDNIEIISLPIDKTAGNEEENQKNNNYREEKESKIPSNRRNRAFQYESEEDDGSYDGTWVDTIPGKAGKDFPAYSEIPKTMFSCEGRKVSGYFADVETDCQVFHVCIEGGQKISFLCPNGSIFNQKVSVCDWWYDVDCSSSTNQVDFINDISKHNIVYDNQDFTYQSFIIEEEPYDLSLASSGGNEHPRKIKQNKKIDENIEPNNNTDKPAIIEEEQSNIARKSHLKNRNKDYNKN